MYGFKMRQSECDDVRTKERCQVRQVLTINDLDRYIVKWGLIY